MAVRPSSHTVERSGLLATTSVPNTGLSLSGTGAYDTYSIDSRFYFDSVNASFNGYQRILDFENRASDQGLYLTAIFVFSVPANREVQRRFLRMALWSICW